MHCQRTGSLPEASEVGKDKAGFNTGESASRVLSFPIDSSLRARSPLFHGPLSTCMGAKSLQVTSVRAWHLTKGCMGYRDKNCTKWLEQRCLLEDSSPYPVSSINWEVESTTEKGEILNLDCRVQSRVWIPSPPSLNGVYCLELAWLHVTPYA